MKLGDKIACSGCGEKFAPSESVVDSINYRTHSNRFCTLECRGTHSRNPLPTKEELAEKVKYVSWSNPKRSWCVSVNLPEVKIRRNFKTKKDAISFKDNFLIGNAAAFKAAKLRTMSKHINKKGVCGHCGEGFMWSGEWDKSYCSRSCASIVGSSKHDCGGDVMGVYQGMSNEERYKLKKEKRAAYEAKIRLIPEHRERKRIYAAEYRKTDRGVAYMYEYNRRQETKNKRNFLRSEEKYGAYAEAHRALLKLETINKGEYNGT